MKNILFYFVLFILTLLNISTSADPLFSKGNSFGFNEASHLQCGSCKKNYPKNSLYCPYCDNVYRTSSNIFAECNHCGLSFLFSPDYATKICFNCQYKNSSESSFCSHCGFRMYYDVFLIECPRCKSEIEYSLRQKEYRLQVCSHCRKKYKSYYKTCPYCDNHFNDNHGYKDHRNDYREDSRNDYREDNRKDYRDNYKDKRKKDSRDDFRDDYREKHRDSKRPLKQSRSVNLGSFEKTDYNSYVKKYPISEYTNQSSFSKVILKVDQRGKHAPILKTIKIKANGKTTELNPSQRLSNGLNEFSANIPEGANEIIFSFGHGADSTVRISLQP